MVEIRLGKQEDYEEIFRMGKNFMETSELIKMIGWERQSIKKLVDLFVTNPNFFGLVAEDNNKLVGMLGIILAPHLFNNKVIVAEEIAWWVEPEHRKGVGEDMLRIAEAALKKKGVKHFSMKYLTNKNMSPEIMKKLYGRKGYKETEIVMMKEL